MVELPDLRALRRNTPIRVDKPNDELIHEPNLLPDAGTIFITCVAMYSAGDNKRVLAGMIIA